MKLNGFKGTVCSDVSLSAYTTWQIGGLADLMVMPSCMSDLQIVMHELSKTHIPWFVLGNGSNVLFSDKGFRGVVIVPGAGFKKISIDGCSVRTGAGVALNFLANKTASAGLSGLEPLAGIPGTSGGAACVNAGAFGSSFLDRCTAIHGIDPSGEEKILNEFQPGYRFSGIPDKFIITDIFLNLVFDNPSGIHGQMIKYLEQRRSTQPLSEASAGCTFKNPESQGAGTLIDKLGLKGFQIGRAMISRKHANFIINTGHAAASDIVEIIRHVRTRVLDVCGVRLDLEVLVIDEFGNRLDPGRLP